MELDLDARRGQARGDCRKNCWGHQASVTGSRAQRQGKCRKAGLCLSLVILLIGHNELFWPAYATNGAFH
jgi:hypothetical protein